MTIAIGVRKRGKIGFDDFWESLLVMSKPDVWDYLPARGYSAVGTARDIFRRVVAKKERSHVLMLDDDAVLHPRTLERLYSRNLPIVAALTWTAELPPAPTLYRERGEDSNGYPVYYQRHDDLRRWLDREEVARELNEHQNSPAWVLDYNPEDAVQPYDVVGLHCVLIAREVLEAVGEPYCEGTETGIREDFDFCERAKKAGYQVHVDRSVIVSHIATHPVRPIDYWTYAVVKQMEDEAHGKEKEQEGGHAQVDSRRES